MSEEPKKFDLLKSIFEQQTLAGRLILTSNANKNAGRLVEARADYERLIAVLRRQLELAELNNRLYPDTPFSLEPIVHPVINALLTLADVLAGLGNLSGAEWHRRESLALSEKYLPEADIAEWKRQYAVSLIPQGRFNEALVAFFDARDLFDRYGAALMVASVTSDIAGILEWLGDYERALAEVKRALDLIAPQTDGKTPTTRDILSNLVSGKLKEAETTASLQRVALDLEQTMARSYRRLGRLDEAERMFRDVFPRLPQDIAEAGIGFQLAAILVERGQFAMALDALQRIEPLFYGLVRQKLGVLLSWRSEAFLGLGRKLEALQDAEIACEELRKYHDADSLWKCEWRRARALSSLGRPKDALGAYMAASETVQSLRRAPLGYRLDSLYLRDKLPMVADAIAMACSAGEAATACHLMEWVKARTLTATLSLPTNKTETTQAGELERRVDDLSRRLDALEYKTYAGKQTDVIEGERASLQKQRADLLEMIRIADPRWRALSEPVPFELDKVLAMLREANQAALSLFLHGDRVVAVLLEEGRCTVDGIDLAPDTMTALSAYQANLQSSKPVPQAFDPGSILALATDRLVPMSILEIALGVGKLVVVPHGLLHLLPWAGLRFGGRRLFDYCPVGILPNLSCLAALQTPPEPSPRVALIGAPDYGNLQKLRPLILSREELEIIAEMYGGAVISRPMVKNEATERSFRQLVAHEQSKGGVLHVACHGDFGSSDPMGAGLLLSDGKVDAAEISRMKLQFAEVILSACSTGYRPTEVQGIPLTGDDILGLPGAFLEAGAKSVLVSIPSARDDATLQFMTMYHEHRSKGQPPLVSFQNTQLAMDKEGVFEPHLWIGFTLYGCT